MQSVIRIPEGIDAKVDRNGAVHFRRSVNQNRRLEQRKKLERRVTKLENAVRFLAGKVGLSEQEYQQLSNLLR